MKKFLQIFKYILSFFLPAMVCMICFGLVYFQFLQDTPTKSKSYYMNDSYDSLSLPIQDNNTVNQHFFVDGQVYGFGVAFNIMDVYMPGSLEITVFDNDNNIALMCTQIPFTAINTSSYTCFNLDTPITSKGIHNLTISVKADYNGNNISSGQMISLKKSSVNRGGFDQLTENGMNADGSLALLIISSVVGDTPVKYYWTAAAVCSILCGLVFFIFINGKKNRGLSVFAVMLSLCCMYQFVLPVFSAPDEFIHFNTAYNISNRWLGVDYNQHGGLWLRESDADDQLRDKKTTVYTYKHISEYKNDSSDSGEKLVWVEEEYLHGYKVPYILSASGITIARIMNMGSIATAFMARFFNMILYCIAIARCYCIAPFAKTGFVALAMLPISVHLGSSVSYDSILISMSFVLTACILDLICAKEKIDTRKLIAVALLSFMIAPLKSAYVLVPTFILAVSDDKFENRKKAIMWKVLIIGVALLHFAKYNLNFVRNSFAVPPASEVAAVETVVSTIPNYSIRYMLTHPGVLLKMTINTFFNNFTDYFVSMIGGKLGYIHLSEVKINSIILIGFVLITAISFIPEKNAKRTLNIWQKLLCLSILLATLAMLIAACITWTPMDYNYIWGFQGRYLLPVLPMLMLAGSTSAVVRTKDITSFVVCSLFALNIFTVLNAFTVIFSR